MAKIKRDENMLSYHKNYWIMDRLRIYMEVKRDTKTNYG